MSRRRTIIKAVIASVLAVGAAAALLVAVSRTVALPGNSITNPDTPFGMGFETVISVGDHVIFLAPTPTVQAGNTITLTAIELVAASRDIHFVDARIYQSKDYDDGNPLNRSTHNQQQLMWHTKMGPKLDPHTRPSEPLVGTPLSGVEPSPEVFTMFEFAVCGPGDLEVKSVKVTYMDGWIRYQQVISVIYGVRNVQPSDISC